MWEGAPYGALAATLKIGNARSRNSPWEPCGYGKVSQLAAGGWCRRNADEKSAAESAEW
jgi:hypothetical protein